MIEWLAIASLLALAYAQNICLIDDKLIMNIIVTFGALYCLYEEASKHKKEDQQQPKEKTKPKKVNYYREHTEEFKPRKHKDRTVTYCGVTYSISEDNLTVREIKQSMSGMWPEIENANYYEDLDGNIVFENN